MTFISPVDEIRQSAISSQASKKILKAMELLDIDSNDLNNEILADSPSPDSDTVEINVDQGTKTLPKPDKRMSIMKQIERLEAIAKMLEADSEELLKQTEEIEESMKNKGNERSTEHQNNSKACFIECHSQKLLQFIRLSLESPSMEKVIKYINGSKSEFKIVNPKKLATLWGKEKGKENLTEHKLNRGIMYLINKKKQLRKVARWTYQFLDNNRYMDVECSTASSPIASEDLSFCSSELSLESDVSKNCPSISSLPKDVPTVNPTKTIKRQRDSSSNVMDWLMKIDKNTNDLKLEENMENNRFISDEQKPSSINQKPVEERPCFIQTSSSQLPVSQVSSTSNSTIIQQSSVVHSKPKSVTFPLNSDNITSLTLKDHQSSQKSCTNLNSIQVTMSEINDTNCYMYCINPSLLTSSLNETSCLTPQAELKVPSETLDDTLLQGNAIEQEIDFDLESPVLPKNLFEMALLEPNFNMDIQYSTVNNIFNSQDLQIHPDGLELEELPTLAHAFSNEAINFNFEDTFSF